MKSFINSGKRIENLFLLTVMIIIFSLTLFLQNNQTKNGYKIYRKNVVAFSDIITNNIKEIYSKYNKTNLEEIYDTLNRYNHFKDMGMETMVIYDQNWKKRFDLGEYRYDIADFDRFLSIYEKDYHHIQDQKIIVAKNSSGKHIIIINPLQNSDGEKIANVYYVFNYEKSKAYFSKEDFIFYFIILILIFTMIIFTKIYRKHQIQQVKEIEQYITYNFDKILDNTQNEFKGLKIVFPYSFIQRKVVFMISKYNEMYKKNIDLIEKNNMLIEKASISILILNEFGNIVDLNEMAAKTLGPNGRESLINYSFYNFFVLKKENNRIKEIINNLKEDNGEITKSTLTTLDRGNLTMVMNFLRPKKSDNIVCYLIDVSELLESEIKELAALKKKKNLVENISNSLIEYTDDFMIVDFNSKFQNLFHKTSKELSGKNLLDVFKEKEEIAQLFERITLYEYNKQVSFFSSSLNKWLLLENNKLVINNESVNIVSITDISLLMKDKIYQEMTMNDLDGFIFIENDLRKLLYLSDSFSLLTGFNKEWFIKNKDLLIDKDMKLVEITTVSNEIMRFKMEKASLLESKNTIYICLRDYEI